MGKPAPFQREPTNANGNPTETPVNTPQQLGVPSHLATIIPTGNTPSGIGNSPSAFVTPAQMHANSDAAGENNDDDFHMNEDDDPLFPPALEELSISKTNTYYNLCDVPYRLNQMREKAQLNLPPTTTTTDISSLLPESDKDKLSSDIAAYIQGPGRFAFQSGVRDGSRDPDLPTAKRTLHFVSDFLKGKLQGDHGFQWELQSQLYQDGIFFALEAKELGLTVNPWTNKMLETLSNSIKSTMDIDFDKSREELQSHITQLQTRGTSIN